MHARVSFSKTIKSVCFFKLHEKPYYYILIKNIHEKIMQSLLNVFFFFIIYLFLLEIAVSYWLFLLLFHIRKPKLSMKFPLYFFFFAPYFIFWHCISKKIALLFIANQN